MRTTVVSAAVAASALIVTCALAGSSAAGTAREAPPRRAALVTAAQGEVAIVQAVPKLTVTVTVDGDEVQQDVAEGDIVGPLELAVGSHEVSFADGSQEVTSTVDVTAGGSSDVVVHRPAEVGGPPVVSIYPTRTNRSRRARHGCCWPTPRPPRPPMSSSTGRRSSRTSPTVSSPEPTWRPGHTRSPCCRPA